MGILIGDLGSRFELETPYRVRQDRVRRRFIDQDEVLRFLQVQLTGDDVIASVRRWGLGQGIEHPSDRGFLQVLASAIASGAVAVLELERAQVRGGGGGGGGDGPGPVPPKPGPKPKPVDPDAKKFRLVELIEVVEQDKERWVVGPLKAAVDKTRAVEGVTRTEKNGAPFKQFINLSPDTEGKAKRHADYGRAIRFRARVERVDKSRDGLAGQKVVFKYTREDGPNRSDPGGGEPAVWASAGLTGDQKEGFDTKNGPAQVSRPCGADGWTEIITFHLSQFAGDQFEISAALDPSVDKVADSPTLKTAAKYQVWRKFWYQMTHAKGYAAVVPNGAHAAYKAVFADMILANTREYEKADLPADLQDRTFRPEYHFKAAGGAGLVANIGTGNVGEFFVNAKTKLEKPADQPLKDILIACEYQIDPAGVTPVSEESFSARSKVLTLAATTDGGDIVSKPPVDAGKALVVTGEYALVNAPWTPLGTLTDADVEIEPGRATTLTVKVTLPAAAPEPTAAAPVWVRLSVRAGASFLGWAPSQGGVVAVYVPGTPAGQQKSAEDFADTAAHEFGHQFNQTALPGKQPPSLKDHPRQYVGHGGSGSHCRHGATVPPGPVDWQNAAQTNPRPRNGDCLQFASFSSTCTHKHCPICRIHMQLEKMDKFGK